MTLRGLIPTRFRGYNIRNAENLEIDNAEQGLCLIVDALGCAMMTGLGGIKTTQNWKC